MANPPKSKVDKLQSSLLAWFRVSGRRFPWRHTKKPYAVLLAEKLLQQTSVRDSTIHAYNDLLSTYPTPEDLAKADPEQVRILIQPLGLHYRAHELVKLACALHEQYGGHVPNDLKSLLALPGVGDYTARAVLCFAFGQDVPIVDTNVARILYRVFGLTGEMPANPARKKELIALAALLVPQKQSRQFNWALLDLGALICKPSKPLCVNCPINTLCSYYSQKKSIK